MEHTVGVPITTLDQPPVVPIPTIEQLRHVATNYPLIDNHAHNLILPTHADAIPFEAITTEAQGRALRDTFKALAHLRAERQLRQLYQCNEDADWGDIMDQRTEWVRGGQERLHGQCFEGVHAILMDDGLAPSERVYPYDYHDKFTKAPTKRIVRIEALAERLMENITRDAKEDDLGRPKFLPDTWVAFTEDFEREIEDAVKDRHVAGFKTVICYRSGLDIEPEYDIAARAVGHPFERYVKNCIRKRVYRIEKKGLADYLVLRTLEILSEQLPRSENFSKPFQFHTGLGDNDINLLEANPAYLQPIIENYPTVPIVLLHSAYPYTREAGYLATVYRHVYLDIGEVFPMVSRDGQRAIIRQAMELTPGNKLLYSSDGHWFSESYYLANLQFREVWLQVISEQVQYGDITAHQAISLTKDILFNNANVLYKLGYEAVFDETVPEPLKQLTFNPKASAQPPYPITPTPSTQDPRLGSRAQTLDSTASRSQTFDPSADRAVSPGTVIPSSTPANVSSVYDVQSFNQFKVQNSGVKFVYIQWLDYMATVRARILPLKQFTRMVNEGTRIGISQGNAATLQNDTLTPLVNTTGQIYIEPDLRSLRPTHNKDPLHAATVLSYWRDESGNPSRECPRNLLETLINGLQFNFSTTMLVGFEIEVVFLSRESNNMSQQSDNASWQQDNMSRQQDNMPRQQDNMPRQSGNTSQYSSYSPLTKTHAWGTLTPEQWLQLPFLSEIVLALEEMGIEVQQFHAESGQGQYEFVLPPSPPLFAVDTLIQARQVIAQIASLHGLRATLHPKPFQGVGTAAHAHVSLNPPDREMAFFVGGVLAHLPAICAFSMPEAVSYSRVEDDTWTGGTWIAWGTQNRETPLRRIVPGRWEIRCIDGLANMYFCLSAIIAAGMLGLSSAPPPVHPSSPLQNQQGHQEQGQQQQQQYDYPQKDTPVNPSRLDENGRAHYGITQRMPRSLDESMTALQRDEMLSNALPGGFVNDYLVMKGSEQRMLGNMGEEERRAFLIERY